jgi:hypothetical protein
VAEGLQGGTWIRQISGGISVPATAQYVRLWNLVAQESLGANPDRLVWRWTEQGTYTSSSAYRALLLTSHPFPGCTRIWKTWAPLRVKIFLWLAFRGRHWTADRRHRHGLDARLECYLCDQEPENIDHIITECSFSRQIWWSILMAFGVDSSQVGGGTILEWWQRWRRRWIGVKRKGADTLFGLVAWELWKERNARLFRNESATSAQFLAKVKQIADLWIRAGARQLGALANE